jgi:Anaphase-promoting complex, cyclosome, subunit 4/Anaphase-promoting complex subunit 4 WD40 domain
MCSSLGSWSKVRPPKQNFVWIGSFGSFDDVAPVIRSKASFFDNRSVDCEHLDSRVRGYIELIEKITMIQNVESEDFSRKEGSTKQCFTKVQERHFWGAPVGNSIRLCPSMDLIAYEQRQGTKSTLLNIHRTLNWQKVASVSSASSSQLPQEDVALSAYASASDRRMMDDCDISSQTMDWRPDGRFVAVAVGETIHIYSVDGLLMAMTSENDAFKKELEGPGEDSEAISGSFMVELGRAGGMESDKQNYITSLSWVHSGTWSEHKLWPFNTSNQNTFLEQKYYHKMYSDRWTYVLPPSEYHIENNLLSDSGGQHGFKQYDHHVNGDDSTFATSTTNLSFPSAQQPLSVLCATTKSGHLHLYLHGRYRIASDIPLSRSPLSSISFCLPILASPDLTHLISATASAQSPGSPSISDQATLSTVSILSFSTISKHRKFYHSFSVLYCRIVQHMDAIKKAIPEICDTWTTSLKPIDLKLDGLQKLLQKYGLVATSPTGRTNDDFSKNDVHLDSPTSLRSLIVHYILSGHTRTAPTLSNAVDQFFTGVQMNDQLLQRMGQTLSSAVANVESNVRKQLVAPATALVHEIDQLYGLSAHRPDLLLTDDTLELLHSAQQLFLIAESTLTNLIAARSRLLDFVAWLRYIGANIKARGTALNSVQRENAKKRRVSESVVRKLLLYLQEQEGGIVHSFGGLTESLLHLKFAATLLHETSSEEAPRGLSNSKHQDDLCLAQALEMTSRIADQVFEYPRSVLMQSMDRTDIGLPRPIVQDQEKFCYCLAMTTRLGQGGFDPHHVMFGGDEKEYGFFTPNTKSESTKLSSQENISSNTRQWLIVAETIRANSIQLRAFALTWTSVADDEFDDDPDASDGLEAEAEWTVNLNLPFNHIVRDVVFFGDDGKSSIVADVGSSIGGKEGHHRLGLLVSKLNRKSVARSDECVELWVLNYDDLRYKHQPMEAVGHPKDTNYAAFRCNILEPRKKNLFFYSVVPQVASSSHQHFEGCENDADSKNVVFARTRLMAASVDFSEDDKTQGAKRTCRLFLSGSRGIGAVSCKEQASTLLQVFDLEEDEEEEEDAFVEEDDFLDAMEEEVH